MAEQKTKARNLLDLLPEKDRKLAIERAEKRLAAKNARRDKVSVPPEFHQICEMGYYYGWEALLAMRRGFTSYVDNRYDDEGNVVGVQVIKEPLTAVDAEIILEGGRKVWYSKLIEQASGQYVAGASKWSKNPSQAFDNGIKPFKDRL